MGASSLRAERGRRRARIAFGLGQRKGLLLKLRRELVFAFVRGLNGPVARFVAELALRKEALGPADCDCSLPALPALGALARKKRRRVNARKGVAGRCAIVPALGDDGASASKGALDAIAKTLSFG